MIDIDAIVTAMQLLFGSWGPWLVIIPGLLIGLIAGAIPGVSGSMALALVLPFTIYLDFLSAVIFITAMFTGAGFGASIPSILLGIPGSTSAVAAAFDGFPMTRQGKHNEALGLALTASSVGMLGSYLLMFLVLNYISTLVLKLGPIEYMLIIFWGLTMIAGLAAGSFTRGLISGLLGILLGTVGMNLLGYSRGTMGFRSLIDGIPAVPALMGFLACSGIYNLLHKNFIVDEGQEQRVSLRKVLTGMRNALRHPLTLLRGSLLGLGIGALPGVGSSISNLISYSEAKRKHKYPDSFGKGNPEGVVAAESANSSSEGGSLGTLLALGIPGGGGTALLLSAFTLHGINVGPRFIGEHKDFVYALIFANFLQGLLLIPIGLIVIRMALLIVKIPLRYLVPSIFVMAINGAYLMTGGLSGPVTVVAGSIVGWLMIRYKYSVAATVVGILLGGTAETSLIQVHQLTAGFELQFLLQRPVSILLFFLIVGLLAYRPLKILFSKRDLPSA
jgi:putative tricarboxylic transport membrane protein